MKRKIRSITAAVLAAAMCAAFTGCGKSDVEKEFENAANQLEKEFGNNDNAGGNINNGGNDTVSSKPDPEPLDAFKDLKVTFGGNSPNGNAKMSGQNSNVKYTLDRTGYDLRNGDIVTVTAELNNSAKDKYTLTETKKEFTVEGLPAYVEKLEDLSEKNIDKLNQNILDSYKDEILNYGDDSKINSMEFLGNYMLFSKDPSSNWNSINEVYFVYKISAYFGISGETQEYYFSARYNYVKKMPDGMVSYNDKPTFGSYDGDVMANGIYVSGACKSLDSLFNQNIADKADAYNYVSSVKDAAGSASSTSSANSEASAANSAANSEESSN